MSEFMKPRKKSVDATSMIDELSMKLFGRTRTEMIISGGCVACGKMIKDGEFRDSLSVREYTISGMCQSCQDGVFGK